MMQPRCLALLMPAWIALVLACCGAGNLGPKSPAFDAEHEQAKAEREAEYDQARANRKAERERKEKVERDAEEAKRTKEAAAEATRPKPNRPNYRKIENGMTVAQVEAILGPGKESASAPGFLILTWEWNFPLTNVISISFQNGRVVAKAIAP